MNFNDQELLFTNVASDYITSLNSTTSVDGALELAAKAVSNLGIENLSLTVDMGSPSPAMIHHLPDWLITRFLKDIVPSGIDPMVRHCQHSSTPIFCGKAFNKQFSNGSRTLTQWLDELSSQGIRSALTIPVHSSLSTYWSMIHLCSDVNAGEFRKIIAAHGNTAILISTIAYNHIREMRSGSLEDETVLTPREQECLLWIAKGERNDGIAHRLNVARATVDFHISNARRKLDARTREQAIAIAVRKGLISP